MIKLGQDVKDKLTGFRGIVTGRTEYLTGCAQCAVQPKATKKGDFVEGRWFDETRLTVVSKTIVTIENDNNPGADFVAPMK